MQRRTTEGVKKIRDASTAKVNKSKDKKYPKFEYNKNLKKICVEKDTLFFNAKKLLIDQEWKSMKSSEQMATIKEEKKSQLSNHYREKTRYNLKLKIKKKKIRLDVKNIS